MSAAFGFNRPKEACWFGYAKKKVNKLLKTILGADKLNFWRIKKASSSGKTALNSGNMWFRFFSLCLFYTQNVSKIYFIWI